MRLTSTIVIFGGLLFGFFAMLTILQQSDRRDWMQSKCAPSIIIQEGGYSTFAASARNISPGKTLDRKGLTDVHQTASGAILKSKFKKLPRAWGPTGGAHLAIQESLTRRYYGKKLTVLAEVCAPQANRRFALAYSTNSIGNSGWQHFTTQEGRHNYCFEYEVPELVAENKPVKHFIGILSDSVGAGSSILLHKLEVYTADQHELSHCGITPISDRASSAPTTSTIAPRKKQSSSAG